jgi:hypothetical protein
MDAQGRSPLPGYPGEGPDDRPADDVDLRRLGEEGGPIGLRLGRNPANLGDEVPEEGDLTTPETVPQTGQI